jgi:iron complex outermembrane receptor protein
MIDRLTHEFTYKTRAISMLKQTLTKFLFATLVFTSLIPFSWAQEDNGLILEEVIVTATRRETSLMETPLAVTALDAETLTREGVRNMVNIGELVPNMQVGLSPSDSGVQLAIRGISSNNFTELGDPTIGIHFDGIYSPRPQGGLALLYDVERIDILRGPQGTLFGRNSTAGTINIISARPQFEEFSGSAEVELGNNSTRAARAWINIPATETVAFRASFMVQKADTYLNQEMDLYDLNWDVDLDGNTDGPWDVPADGVPNVDQRRNKEQSDSDAYGSIDRWAARLSMRFAPTDEIDWLITYEQFQDNSPGVPFLKDCEKAKGTFFACDDQKEFDVKINTPGELDMKIKTIRSEFVWDVSDSATIEYRFAHASQDRSQLFDQDGGAFPDVDHPGYGINIAGSLFGGVDGVLIRDPQAYIDLGFEPRALQPFEDLALETEYSRYKSNVHDIIIKSDGDSQLSWLFGYFHLQEDNAIKFNVEIPFCCGFIRPLAQSFVQPKRTVKSDAFFGQFDFAVNDKLNLTAGYRHTWDKKEDVGGSNHQTTGYWTNPGLYSEDPDNTFWYESWTFTGPGEPFYGFDVPFWTDYYQSDDLAPNDGTLGADFTTRVPGTDNSHRAKWNKGTWRLGFDYIVKDDLFIYGYAATGYKAGGFGDNVDTCECGNFTTFDFDPEEVTTYELGLKSTLAEGSLNLMANIFYSDYDNMQKTFFAIVGESIHSGNDIGTNLTTNIAESTIKGVEIEFDWYPYDGGRLYGWVAYLDAEIKDLPAGDGWFCFERALLGLTECPPEEENTDPNAPNTRPTNFKGNQLPWSPKFSATLTGEHNWYFDNGLRLSPVATVHWQSEMFFQDNNFDEGPFHSGQKAYATVNASLRLISEEKGWGMELYVYNLFDERTRNWADYGPGYVKSSFAPPRAYGAKFRYDF